MTFRNPCRRRAMLSLFLSGLALAPAGRAQVGEDTFVTGAAKTAYDKWQTLMQSVAARDRDLVEFFSDELLAANVSPLRLALLEERSVRRRENAGAVLLFEQDQEAGALGEKAGELYARLDTGREQMNEADDGWYFCSVGRFDVAHANFSALLAAEPDPVAVLEFADRVPRRTQILVQLSDSPQVGESARAMLRLLQEGEERIKSDPTRIIQQIDRLGGAPREFETSVTALKRSGEYSIPFLTQALRDSEKRALTQAILRTLPLIDREGLNPLVMALRMDDTAAKKYVIRALGQIGYWQSVPYLLKLRQDPATAAELLPEIDAALRGLAALGVSVDPGLSAADAFYALANGYYAEREALAADPRLDFANVWYWKDNLLQNVEVPTAIFDEIMALRCCEEALLLNPDLKPALALWLAANLRREAQIPEGASDATRPANYPSAAYFAQSAGPEYNLRALARAIDNQEPAVAMGAIEALRKTAGPASVLDAGLGRTPLAEALSFPDRMVRIRAAIALAASLPQAAFSNSQNLMPVLNEAVMLFGGARNALVIDPDAATGNTVAAALRAIGYEVIIDSGLYNGLQKVRSESPGVDLICLASDLQSPSLAAGLSELRHEFRFAMTPVLVITKPADAPDVRTLVRADARVAAIAPDGAPESLNTALAVVARTSGVTPITPEVGATVALEAALTLNKLAVTNNPVLDVSEAENALVAALEGGGPALRETVAHVLAAIDTRTAQEAIAAVALDETEDEAMRITMFAALAEAAKLRGGLLSPETADQARQVAETHANMAILTAASQALGALNQSGNPASAIIRNQYGG